MDQPAEQANNEAQFEEILRAIDPELYLVYEAQKLTSVNWDIIREVIGAVHDVAFLNGSGQVRIFILNGIGKAVQGEKNLKMEVPVILEKDK